MLDFSLLRSKEQTTAQLIAGLTTADLRRLTDAGHLQDRLDRDTFPGRIELRPVLGRDILGLALHPTDRRTSAPVVPALM